ncbi:putative pectinesterase 11, partial [Ananas comosus]
SYANGAPNSHSSVHIRVDQSGRGDFTKIQDAIDSVPSGNSNATFILVEPGIYNEKVMVPVDKPLITLSGTNAYSTIITWNEPWTNVQAPTVSIMASDFVGKYLTIQNTFGPGAQAVALRVSGDRAAFYACRFISFQDTVLDDAGRHYYKNCYIEGATDVICGDGKALFEKCHLHSVSTNGGALTAQRRGTAAEDTGYSFVGCKVTGVGKMILGRPWGLYSRVVFANTYMTNAVLPRGRCSSENTDLMDLDQMPQEELCGLTSFHSLKPCRSCRRCGSTVRIGSQTLHQSIHDIQKL